MTRDSPYIRAVDPSSGLSIYMVTKSVICEWLQRHEANILAPPGNIDVRMAAWRPTGSIPELPDQISLALSAFCVAYPAIRDNEVATIC